LVLPVLIAGLLAPSAVASKKTTYLGQPLLGPPAQSARSVVLFKAIFQGQGRKLRPVTVLKYQFYDLTVSCSQPQPGSTDLPYRVSYSTFGKSFPVNNREFAFRETQPAPYGYSGSQTFEIRGRIPRRGPVMGTIHYTGSWTPPDSAPVTCDSTTSWTATPSPGAEGPG
jgi:hypothetical protein